MTKIQMRATKEERAYSHPLWKGILAVVGGIVVHLSLGAAFTFGNFVPYIASYMKFRGEEPDLRQSDLVWVSSVNCVGFGCCMFLAGPLERKIGSRLSILFSSFLMSFFILLSSYTINKDLISFAITDGFMIGGSVSIGYPITLRVAMKWLPAWKSTVSGLVLAGHGGSSAIFTQVITAFINPENYKPNITIDGEKYFDNDILLDRVPWCFIMLGCTFIAIQIIGTAMILTPPPDEDDDVTHADTNEHLEKAIHTVDSGILGKQNIEVKIISNEPQFRSMKPKEMLKTRQFYILWFICILNGQSVMFVSSLYKAYGLTFISDDHFLASVGSIAAVGNTLGRPAWGLFADKFGEKISFSALSIILTVLQGLMNLSETAGRYYFLIVVFFVFFNGTGTYAVLSSATYNCFGPKYYSSNFGLVYTSQAITGILTSTLTTTFKSRIGWHGMFWLSAGLTGVCFILTLFFTVNVDVPPPAKPVDIKENTEDVKDVEKSLINTKEEQNTPTD